MRTIVLSLGFSLLLGAALVAAGLQQKTPSVNNQLDTSYSMLWDEVKKQEEASLPESAGKLVDNIYEKALLEKNSPQLIKSMIHRLKYQAVKDKDGLPDRLQEIETYTAGANNVVEKSMLYSVLAKLYQQYFSSNSYEISGRTAIGGDLVPEDIREWSGNLFIQKIREYTFLSVESATELQKADILDYKEILNEGTTSRKLYPTVYDFLVKQGIESLNELQYLAENYYPQSQLNDKKYFSEASTFANLDIQAEPYDLKLQVLKLYQSALSFRLANKKEDDLLMNDLSRLKYVYEQSSYTERNVDYIAALAKWEKQYAKNPLCVEVLYEQALYYTQNDFDIQPLRTAEGKWTLKTYDPENESEMVKKRNESLQQAYDICTKGIEQFPSYERIGLLQNVLESFTHPNIVIQHARKIYPGNPLKLKLDYRNTQKLTIECYQINESFFHSEYGPNKTDRYKLPDSKRVGKQTLFLEKAVPYLNIDTLIEIPFREEGLYEFIVYANDNKDESKLVKGNVSVTPIHTAVRRVSDEQFELLVTDRISGKPTEKFHAVFYKQLKGMFVEVARYHNSQNGLMTVPYNKDMRYYAVYTDKNTPCFYEEVPYFYSRQFNKKDSIQKYSRLFTDRSIYRPGQTVFFKGILSSYSIPTQKEKASTNQKVKVVLRNANNEEVDRKEIKSNEFGSFAGEFILPTGGMNGEYTLLLEGYNTRQGIQVEEYKRPTFDIQFDTLKTTYSFGDRIKIKGNVKTFSGIDLQQTEVKYRVERCPHWLGRFRPHMLKRVGEGTVKTDNQGRFELVFTAEKEFADKDNHHTYYTYQVEVTVTSAGGETQTSQTNVSVGDKSMVLSIGNIERLNKDSLQTVEITASNLNGQQVDKEGTYQLFSLIDKKEITETVCKKPYKTDRQVGSGSFSTRQALLIHELRQATSGRYRLVLKSADNQGREVTAEQDFILYSLSDKRPPVTTPFWVVNDRIECRLGETADIYIGSSYKDVYVLQDVFQQDKKLSSKRFKLSNSVEKISLPYASEYGNGIQVVYTFIKEEKLYSNNIYINLKEEKKQLIVKTEVFRDKIIPGGQEEWKISVKDQTQQTATAEVLAGMYDASLDKLMPHQWYINSPSAPYNYIQTTFSSNSERESWLGISLVRDNQTVPSFAFDAYNWFGLDLSGRLMSLRFTAPMVMEESKVAYDNAAPPPLMTQAENASFKLGAGSPTPKPQIQVRSRFDETAFFYPQLRTNKEGETLISFTVPESNTTWKFMALAHTRDMAFGQLVKEAISQKQLMVTPNMPRFMRQGDNTFISTLVSNLSDKQQKGEVTISFFVPAGSNPPLFLTDNQTQQFDLAPGESSTFSWQFDVPAGLDMTECRIVAQSETFSDGEQHLLPVLTNKVLVTESLPLTISGKGSRKFTFDKLKNNRSETAEDYRLTLEFAANPAWYAVQALPAMSQPENDNTISWFAAYYANTLAAHIARTSNVNKMVEIWKKQDGEKKTLLSNLEKNSELKAVLLEETPWVLEAKDETEQRQSLGLLFDTNRNQLLTGNALEQLKKLQKEDGSWPWIEGMRGSTSITQWILYGLGNLESLQAISKDASTIREMQQQAVAYIDYEFKRAFENKKKYTKDMSKLTGISTYELEYLYVRSFYKEIPEEGTEEATAFFMNILEKHWAKDGNLYHRALMAMVMQRAGKPQVAQSMIRSLKEHATKQTDRGMYWANDNQSSFFFRTNTGVHTFIMNAFEEVGGQNKEDIEAMKLWLLKQKQTHQWESTPATVNAVYALFNGSIGDNWLESKGEVNIAVGNNSIDLSGAEAGTGYIKKSYNGAEIKPEMASVSLSKTDEGPAWGALYWQYFEESDKVTKAKTALHIEKKLFIEKTAAAGKVLEEINDATQVKKGDKVVVRLTIRSDRDMEYVMLKDMYGAGLEPAEQISRMEWNHSLHYYRTGKDASTRFYFDYLPKGTYVLEYGLYASRAGNYSNGLATLQCLYAPEFISHSEGTRIGISEE